jgi:hypothetical protein
MQKTIFGGRRFLRHLIVSSGRGFLCLLFVSSFSFLRLALLDVCSFIRRHDFAFNVWWGAMQQRIFILPFQ